MDLLIDPLSELLAPLAMIALAFAALLAVAILCGLGALALWMQGRGRPAAVGFRGPIEIPLRAGRRRWLRPLRTASLLATGMAASVPIAVAVIDRYYFTEAAQLLCAHAASPGETLSFQSATGNLLKGRIEFQGFQFNRETSGAVKQALAADALTLDIAVWPLAWGRRSFDEVTAIDVQARFTDTPELFAKRASGVVVRRLRIERARWEIPQPAPAPAAVVELTSLTANDWRADWALHDSLFRSTARGRIEGESFELATQETEAGSLGQMRVRDVPVRFLADRLGGWWSLLSAGSIDVEVEHRRERVDLAPIDLRVGLVLRDVELEMPTRTLSAADAWMRPAAEYLSAHDQRVSLRFDLLAAADAFQDVAAATAGDLRNALTESARRALEHRSRDGGALRSLLRDGFDSLDDDDLPVAVRLRSTAFDES